ncbi:hypothetical protein AGR56_14725 [Clostridium sp. DMHC 10]|uniref:DUF1836 domain-containing protein n=1 Tax=Clostridium sp. DMHC 10 TaxID=747377 RepID=UPI00069FCBC0|nr:DUF1836 domain-containing protein [Clostridium sp. DMHC 10]KOF57583.1 hypothetical protein AGR56_14725 [Clostridium sp. DMHC 10]
MYDDILKLADEIANYIEIKDYEIPDIDLYMDQVTSFMNNKLSDFKRNNDDIILSKTMINNYAKNKVIPSPNKKKKYSKKHMMILIWVYHLKQTLSINDIGKLMNFMTVDEKNSINYTEIYNSFLDIQNKSSKNLKTDLEKMFQTIEGTNSNFDYDEKLFLLVLELILSANIQKRLAEKIIDNCFNNQ